MKNLFNNVLNAIDKLSSTNKKNKTNIEEFQTKYNKNPSNEVDNFINYLHSQLNNLNLKTKDKSDKNINYNHNLEKNVVLTKLISLYNDKINFKKFTQNDISIYTKILDETIICNSELEAFDQKVFWQRTAIEKRINLIKNYYLSKAFFKDSLNLLIYLIEFGNDEIQLENFIIENNEIFKNEFLKNIDFENDYILYLFKTCETSLNYNLSNEIFISNKVELFNYYEINLNNKNLVLDYIKLIELYSNTNRNIFIEEINFLFEKIDFLNKKLNDKELKFKIKKIKNSLLEYKKFKLELFDNDETNNELINEIIEEEAEIEYSNEELEILNDINFENSLIEDEHSLKIIEELLAKELEKELEEPKINSTNGNPISIDEEKKQINLESNTLIISEKIEKVHEVQENQIDDSLNEKKEQIKRYLEKKKSKKNIESNENLYLNILDKKILIVDENKLNLRILEGLLYSNHFTNIEKTSFEHEIYYFLSNPKNNIEILLIPYQMEKTNGLLITKHIRLNLNNKDIIIIIATSNNDKELMAELLNSEVDAVIVKPIKPFELKSSIKKALSKRNIIKSEEITNIIENKEDNSSKLIENIKEIQNNYNIENKGYSEEELRLLAEAENLSEQSNTKFEETSFDFNFSDDNLKQSFIEENIQKENKKEIDKEIDKEIEIKKELDNNIDDDFDFYGDLAKLG